MNKWMNELRIKTQNSIIHISVYSHIFSSFLLIVHNSLLYYNIYTALMNALLIESVCSEVLISKATTEYDAESVQSNSHPQTLLPLRSVLLFSFLFPISKQLLSTVSQSQFCIYFYSYVCGPPQHSWVNHPNNRKWAIIRKLRSFL
jgi:hypothetical protein